MNILSQQIVTFRRVPTLWGLSYFYGCFIPVSPDGYYLILTQGEEDREVFDRVSNVISEYGIPKRSTPASLTFLEAHCSKLIAEHASQRPSNTSM